MFIEKQWPISFCYREAHGGYEISLIFTRDSMRLNIYACRYMCFIKKDIFFNYYFSVNI